MPKLMEKKITINGKRKSFYGKTEREILQKIAAYQGEVEKGKSFEEVAREWERKKSLQLSKRMMNNYKSYVQRSIYFFHSKTIKDIRAKDIDSLLYSIQQKGYSSKTAKTQKSVLNMIFKYAILQDYTEVNPCLAVDIPMNMPKKRREIPPDEDIKKIINSTSCTFGLFAYFLLFTGCRKGEALALTYEDIDLKNNVIHINKNLEHHNQPRIIDHTKTPAGMREIILPENVAALLPKKQKGIIFHKDHKYLSYTQFLNMWKTYCKEANLTEIDENGKVKPSVTPHQLRHYYSTILFEAGIDEFSAKTLLGHTDITLTRNIYTHYRKTKAAQDQTKLNDYIKSLV